MNKGQVNIKIWQINIKIWQKWHKDLTSQHNYLTSDGRSMPPYVLFKSVKQFIHSIKGVMVFFSLNENSISGVPGKSLPLNVSGPDMVTCVSCNYSKEAWVLI